MEADTEFREFVAGHGRALMATAFALTGDRHRAEDLVQIVLAKLATRWGQQRDPVAYAKSAIYREFCSWWRVRRHHEIPRDEITTDGQIPDFSDQVDARVVLAKALLKLSRRQRAFVILRYYEDRTESETAEIIGCAVGTVKSQTHKALRKLRQQLPDLERSGTSWSM